MADEQRTTLLLSRRTTLLAALGRAEAFLATYEAERDQAQIPLRLEYLNSTWATLEDVQGQLEDMETSTDGKALLETVRADFEPRLFRIKSCLLTKLPPLPDNSHIPQPPRVNSALSGLKLPTISLPEFDGDYKQWLAFYDTFLALIHSNPDVAEIQKFHYLRAAVKGEAAQLIESIGISSANYNLAWETLKGRYANDYLLKKRHLQALFDISPMEKENSAALHGLVDEFERHTKILRQLGEPTGPWSTILEHLLCTRLHDDTLKAWEDHASTVDDPHYDCLIEFLQRRIRVLESISVNHHSSTSGSKPHSHQTKRSSQFRVSSCASTTAAGSSSGDKCIACNQQHWLIKCPKFNRFSTSERRQFVQSKRLCHNCLRKGHMVQNCSSNFSCKHCNRRHHSLLHSAQNDSDSRPSNGQSRQPNSNGFSNSVPANQAGVQPTSSTSADSSQQSSVAATEAIPSVEVSTPLQQCRENVFLLTVMINVVDVFGQEHPARALLDSASQPNLITERMAEILHLKRNRVNVTIQGAGKMSKNVRESVFAQVKSRKDDFSCGVSFLVMDKVTADLPSHNISTVDWKIPTDLFLADPSFNKSQPIDMVIGAKHFYSFFPSAARVQITENHPLLVDSVFGWIVAGSANQTSTSEMSCTTTSASIVAVSLVSLEDSLERFWKTEDLMIKDNYSVEERRCESLFQSTVKRNSEGRYIVRLPRKSDFDIMLGDSKASAIRRFDYLERRLERNPQLKEEYHQFMREYLELDHMRLVNTEERDDSRKYYLPHHPVFKESSTTTKIRVVFDGSAKTTTNISLNEALCVGPVIQDDLLSIILRFRTFPVALVGDIAKMYRQVLVHPEDASLQRILWRFSPEHPVQTFVLRTVTYGLAPSSFLATRTLQQLSEDEGEMYPVAAPAVRKNFYVDDFIGGAKTVEAAIQLRVELAELLQKGGFTLRKWTSNQLSVLEGLDKEQIGTQSTVQFSPNETVKTLGINWEPESDVLRFDSQVEPDAEAPTKRSILSAIAKLFDPLGLIAPVVVRAKILMQQLWLLSCGWDDPVPENILQMWEAYHKELPKISAYRVQRYAFLPDSNVQLHTFADASKDAYGACTYARCEDGEGNIKIQLLASKSRVAPLKRLSIARLELCAAVLAAHLHDRVKKAIEVEISASYFWSDSAVTLHWLKSPPNTWKTFVANRVSEIQHFTRGCRWNHISGIENPADLVSRGMSVDQFLHSKLWIHGPRWLALPLTDWPISNPPKVAEEELECQLTVSAVQSTVVAPNVHPLFLRWSSYTRLLHVIAYCMRFIDNTRSKARTQYQFPTVSVCETLTVEQLGKAKTYLVRLAQEDTFVEEIRDLQQKKVVSKRSRIRLLHPFIDTERVVRVGGRLNLSELPYQSKHPALLPSSHPFTRLVAEQFHRDSLHAGGRLLLTAIRAEYWPLQGWRLAHSVVKNCYQCTRLDPVPVRQQIGQLPAQRVVPSRPFNVTGVDYAGPIYLKAIHKRAAPTKAYLCLFVCFTTKAVHLELVGDLSTKAFLCALRRFIARRGRPAHIHSDNGKNFEGAKNELAELFTMFENPMEMAKITAECSDKGINWHLVPPKAPHFGGLWEAAVKVAKKHLYRQLGPSRLSFEDMSTVLTQIEALMNSRPLVPLSEDPNDLAALTPAHFLIGTTMNALPDPDVRDVPVNRLDEYQKQQAYVQKFWYHWRTEYLQELQRDTTRFSRNNEILPGRMVVIVDEMQPPIRWPLARIHAIHPGEDGITRVVSLRCARGIITRPTAKICLLPSVEVVPAVGDVFPEATNPQPVQREMVPSLQAAEK